MNDVVHGVNEGYLLTEQVVATEATVIKDWFRQRNDAMQAWIEEELQTVDLGDERLNDRYRIILDRVSRKPSASFPAACRGWAETLATYRFFDNRRIDLETVLSPHQQATLERVGQQDVALLLQDTTEIDLTRKEERVEGAGPLSDASHWGFYDHAMLAVTPERIPLGVVDAKIWARDPEEFEKNLKLTKKEKQRKRQQQSIEEKESYRWVEGYRWACHVAAEAPETTIICISDSEGDIHECLQEAASDPKSTTPNSEEDSPKAEWIVRACQDRSLTARQENGRGYRKLWEQVGSTKVRTRLTIEVSRNEPRSKDGRRRRQPRSARTATATVQAKRVTIKAPRRPGEKLRDVVVNAILVRETNPPRGEEPVEWLLLTSLPINTIKQICLVIEYYCCRWQIEIYFRVLKSGCKIEERQLENGSRYQPCLALYMVVAWRVMYVLMLGRQCPEMSCDAVFSDDEWKAVYTIVHQSPPPSEPPSMEEMVYMIASLGGHLGRTHDGPPGPKAMWIGMQRMTDLAMAWRAFGPRRPMAPGRVISV